MGWRAFPDCPLEGDAVAGTATVLYSAPMMNFLRTLEFLGLSMWLGSDVCLSFVVAPGACRILACRVQDVARVVIGPWRTAMTGVVAGSVIRLARPATTRTPAS